MSGKKKVIKNSILYSFSAVLVQGINFLLLPIYTLFLSPADYGVTNLVNSFIQVAIFLIAFSLYSAVLRFYTDYKNDSYKLKRFFSTIINFVCVSGLFFSILGFVFRNLLSIWFFKGIEFFPIILISLLSMIFVSLYTLHQSIVQVMQQGKKLTIINICVFGLTVILKLFFLIILDLGVTGFILAQLLVNIGYFAYIVFDLKSNGFYSLTIDFSILKESLKYSLPLMPHNLSTRLATFTSRIFINNSGTLASVGLYSIAMNFGSLIDLIQTSINNAFQPWFFDMLNTKNSKNKDDAIKFSYVLLSLYSIMYMVIGLFSQEAVMIMTSEKYIESWKVIPILIAAFSVKSIYYFFVNIVMFHKEASRKLFIATIFGSFIDIILAYVLVPSFGMYGAGVAFLIAKVTIVIIVVLLSKKYDRSYSFFRMIKIIIPSLVIMNIGLIFSYTKFTDEFDVFNFLFKLFVLLFYCGFIYFKNRVFINDIVSRYKEVIRVNLTK